MTNAVTNQDEVIAFLSDPATHGIDAPVERITTHISEIFLAGDKAYKLKRAVRFPYLDYTDIARRKHFCEAEVAVNRRTAPDLYDGVVAVARGPDGKLSLGGAGAGAAPGGEPGEAMDWLVAMKRFDQETIWDAMARRHAIAPANTPIITRSMVSALADVIAEFHLRAAPHRRNDGARSFGRVVDGVSAELTRYTPEVFSSDLVAQFDESIRHLQALAAPLLDRRGRQGRVRHCHGDLHLRNICQVDGVPTLFDAIEFSDDIAVIDVLYDLAFLLMDLEHRNLRPLANQLLNRYLSLTGDIAGLAAMPMLIAVRAGIRAHVTATAATAAPQHAATAAPQQAAQDVPGANTRQDEARLDEARAYLGLALAALHAAPPRLIAIGGMSGSGKSTIARAVAPKFGPIPGAVHLQSDVIRKRLAGVAPETRLDELHYTPEITRRVYGRIGADAAAALKAGYSVIADATYLDPTSRSAIARVAEEAGAPFTGLWLQAAIPEMERRLEARRGDASDARVEVLRRQMTAGAEDLDWEIVDAGGDAEATAIRVAALLGLEKSGTV